MPKWLRAVFTVPVNVPSGADVSSEESEHSPVSDAETSQPLPHADSIRAEQRAATESNVPEELLSDLLPTGATAQSDEQANVSAAAAAQQHEPEDREPQRKPDHRSTLSATVRLSTDSVPQPLSEPVQPQFLPGLPLSIRFSTEQNEPTIASVSAAAESAVLLSATADHAELPTEARQLSEASSEAGPAEHSRTESDVPERVAKRADTVEYEVSDVSAPTGVETEQTDAFRADVEGQRGSRDAVRLLVAEACGRWRRENRAVSSLPEETGGRTSHLLFGLRLLHVSLPAKELKGTLHTPR